LGESDSQFEEGEILEEKEEQDRTVHKEVLTLNYDDEDEYNFEENQVNTFLAEELLAIEGTRESPRTTGKPVEKKKKTKENDVSKKSTEKITPPPKRREQSGKSVRSPKQMVHGKSELFLVQKSGKSDGCPPPPKKSERTVKPVCSTKQMAHGKSGSFPEKKSGKSDSFSKLPPQKNSKKALQSLAQTSGKSDTSSKKRTEDETKKSGKPDFEKISFDPSLHYVPGKKKIPRSIKVPRKDSGESNLSSTNSQFLLRRTSLVNTRQFPRDNVTVGINRDYNVPRVFTAAKRGDFRSYYKKFLKKNLSGPTFDNYGKYLLTRILDLIRFCVEREIKVNNSDIEDKLHSFSVNEDFFGSRNKDIYLQMVDMIYNSIHSSLSGIPIQRTVIPGKNKNSWIKDISTEEKKNLVDVYLYDRKENFSDDSTNDHTTEDETSKKMEEEFFHSAVDNAHHFTDIEIDNQSNSSSCSEEIEFIKVEKTQKLLNENNYKIPKKKKKTKVSLGKSQSILHDTDQHNMVPLKPTTKGNRSRSEAFIDTAPSSTSSSKRSAESVSITHNYLEEMDDEMELAKKYSRKTSKLSENDSKHHKKISPSSKMSIFESMYAKYISKFETKNWRLTANIHFEKVYKDVHQGTREGFKNHFFPRTYFIDNQKSWSHIREETFNQQIDNMVKLVTLRTESIAAQRSLKSTEIRYIFYCLRHIFWDAGFQAQVFLKQTGLNKSSTLSSLKSKGLFTNSCILTMKMKKCLQNYPGLTEIITKYTGKTTRWHCSNESCTFNSNFNTYWGLRSIALREEAKDPSKGCMIHYCMYMYLKMMYKDITEECERIYNKVKEHLYTKHPSNFHFSDIFDLQR